MGLAYDEYCGVAAIDKDLLDLRAIGLKSGSRIGRRVSVGTANLAEIPQLWLRALLRAWLDAERPNGDYFHRALRAAVLAGQALSCRPGGGHDIATLQFADMSAVADQFRNALRRDDRLYGAQERHHLFGRFCELLNFGRYTGLLDDISGSFARHPSHRIILEDPNEDEIGKAIPEFVIRQLDAALDSIALDTTYGELTGDDIQAMFRTVYVILRDTGRRPGEVASLTRDCLETIDGETSLVFDNRKGKRVARTHPVGAAI